MTDEPERDAQKDLEEIFFKVLSTGGPIDGLQTPTVLAKAALDYFRPAIEVMDVDQQMHNLDLAADEVTTAQHLAELFDERRREAQRQLLWTQMHPFRNLWRWVTNQ